MDKIENKKILIAVAAIVVLAAIAVIAVSITGQKNPVPDTKPTPTVGNTGGTGGGSEKTPAHCYCVQVYQPVCGADGKTYGNSCEAGCAGVKVAYEGACGAKNIEKDVEKDVNEELEKMLEELEKEEGGLESELPAPPQ